MSFLVERWPDLLLFKIHNKIIHSISTLRAALYTVCRCTHNDSLLCSWSWSPTRRRSRRRRRCGCSCCCCWLAGRPICLYGIAYDERQHSNRRARSLESSERILYSVRSNRLSYARDIVSFSTSLNFFFRNINMHESQIHRMLPCRICTTYDAAAKKIVLNEAKHVFFWIGGKTKLGVATQRQHTD